MKSNNVRLVAFTGMFAALVFLVTWAIHVPAGLNGGYVHFGDALVYLAASMLPLPYAMAASAIGAGLSDMMSGAPLWIIPTVIIKSLCCLPFTRKSERVLCRRNVVALVIAALITMVGYGSVSAFMAGNIMAFLADVPNSIIQSAGSALCFAVIAAALDKTKLKSSVMHDTAKENS